MYSRINDHSDVLTNGKIMLFTDNESGCYTLTDLQYSEHAFQELLVDTHKAIREATLSKNDYTFDAYVNVLVTLTNNLKNITESLLAVKAAIQTAKGERSTTIAASYQIESVECITKKVV